MKTYCHAPWVPEALLPILDVAYNFWWTTDRQARWFFDRISNGLFDQVDGNPVKLLRLMGETALREIAANPEFVRNALEIRERMRAELEAGGRFTLHPTRAGVGEGFLELAPRAAYFSAEFGIHESLPIYSGGLGVLAGDHVRSAGDIDLPFVGVGLLYRQGYFHQSFSLDNWQQEDFRPHGFHDLPIKLVVEDDGTPITVAVNLGDREVRARIWVAQVGRSSLLLLDTYRRSNWREDREITARLYDADRERRLLQEILLGIGGVRALTRLGVAPHRFHMNEGHSAFLVLERAADLRKQRDLSFEEARAALAPSHVFTTHTPVPAGHERFDVSLMDRYFGGQLERLGLDRDAFLALGRKPEGGSDHEFEMTALAIRFSESINGVSELHGAVAREQWRSMWPGRPVDQVPIGHVTNGVHAAGWTGGAMDSLFARHLAPDWARRVCDRELWERIEAVPDRDLWDARNLQRAHLVDVARRAAQAQLIARNVDRDTLVKKISRLDPDALTIGFARRFATYKRADLFMRHVERLAALVSDSRRPVQFIFAGKAHPADEGGKKLLQRVIELSLDDRFVGRILVLEDYDMGLARALVQGCDVWLNTPRPPKEASGTSGMKACCNGALTVSTRDGWWVEGFDGRNGWQIGQGHDSELDEHTLDEQDADSLIEILEREVVPLFFERGPDGMPSPWLARVRASIRGIVPFFNTTRMVREYADRYYGV
ncbi:MAG: alpha-glucan family phosphorylase [Planctomycetota bacterium]